MTPSCLLRPRAGVVPAAQLLRTKLPSTRGELTAKGNSYPVVRNSPDVDPNMYLRKDVSRHHPGVLH